MVTESYENVIIDPKYLQDRHHLPAEMVRNLEIAGVLAEQAAQ